MNYSSARALVWWVMVATVAGCYDFEALTRDYGKDGAEVRPDLANSVDIARAAFPTNCTELPTTCGPNQSENCCTSLLVPGGTFNRSNDPAYPATVSSFRLDKYEVTIGRFRAFVGAGMGTQAAPPAAGAGAGIMQGTGWDRSWNGQLLGDGDALRAALRCEAAPTWTDAPAGRENLPINCVSWYEAFAFCAWDGGKLPTEAEWNYAAAGGSEQRPYPWGKDVASREHATFAGAVSPVGSHSPTGDARWGHADMAGNLWEWVFDFTGQPQLPCTDCSNTTPTAGRMVRGGSVAEQASGITTDTRISIPPSRRQKNIGLRCARPL